MFLAPLNFDRFFKKVFSELQIAKKFLEDFLDIEIEEIERLPTKHKVTDDASFIEFDFRCKSNGHYFIVDMQQWYKSHVVKRFYLYNSLNSSLQLDTLPKKDTTIGEIKSFDTKIYGALLPTITLIWMCTDNLGFVEDYISYALFPEQTVEFLKNESLWASLDYENIDRERKKVLTLLDNKTKNLDFLPQNRLIFAFQKNIVKNKKMEKYVRWFDFAEKTRNKDNVEDDFLSFKNDNTFMAVMERIETGKFDEKELDAFEALQRELALSAVWKLIEKDDMRIEIKEEVREEVKEEVREEVKEEVREEIKKELEEEKDIKTVVLAHKQGLDTVLIAAITLLPLEKVKAIIDNYSN